LESTSVSVVIPFHNGSVWIERALKSTLEQTLPVKEIIVVDDGSVPSEAAKLQDLRSTYSFEILSQVNSGQSAARNLGVSNAAGDYICLLDQDDYFLPRHVETLLATADLRQESFGFAYGDLLRVDSGGRIISDSSLVGEHPHIDVFSMISKNMHILPSATLIKRSAFMELGGFDESLQGYEDDDLFLRFHLSGYRIDFTSEPVSAWTVNASSTSFSESMSRSRYLYFKKLVEMFDNDEVIGNKVFESALFPRFAYKFADDVIYSVLNGSEHFQERSARLKSFVQEVRDSKNIKPSTRRRYLIATLPLVTLGSKSLGYFLWIALKSAPVFKSLNIHLLDEFLARHSTLKKSV
jgi:glycosyltransferase involved in cell wall biosynthesis